MSLNGLDDAKVKEAHDAAVAEPGGWFLLKYVSRDEIELLSRGNGGIVDIRNSIAQYEETSPLFGFLRYRRRNVIIKYLPEDCSRLVQARATVHFNSVCERFAPFDTTFTLNTAKELKDTKLSAACSLHAASGSTSSSTSSLRRRRLMEIAEEEEEEQRERKRQSVVKEESDQVSSTGAPDIPTSSQNPPVTLNSNLARSPEHSKFSVNAEPPPFVGVRPPSPAKSLDTAARRISYAGSRPDIYSSSSYSYSKNRVKLGPRPSLDIGGRPRTSAGTSTYRPISSIPAGFKLFSKGSKKGKSTDKSSTGADSQIKEESPNLSFLAPSIPIPENPPPSPGVIRPHTSGGRPTTSSGVSIKSALPSFSLRKQNTETPEKARLKKAMQLREKKKKMSIQPPPIVPAVDIEEAPAMPEVIANDQADEHQSFDHGELLASGERDGENRSSISKADSGIDVGPANVADHMSVDTLTDSHPASPLAMSSEIGESTKASSLSESTDETVQPETVPPDAEHKSEEVQSDHNEAQIDKTTDQEQEEELPEKRMSEIQEGSHEDMEEDFLGQEEATPIQQEANLVEPRYPGETTEQASQEREEPEETTKQGPLERQEPVLAIPLSKFAAMPVETQQGENDAAERSPTVSKLKIPTSKFSTHDLRSSYATSAPTAAAAKEEFAAEDRASIKVEEGSEADTSSVGTKRSKRKALIEPIKTDLGVPFDREAVRTESNFSDDEDLLEELQSATVQQAQPMTVSKSPITPVFPNLSPPKQSANGGNTTPRVIRTASNPIRGPLLVPGDVSSSSARAVSSGAAFLHKITQQASPGLTSKKSVGSSISQRIKALEKLSGTSGGANDNQARAERPSSTFFSVRKSSVREPSRSPSVVERTTSLTRAQTPSPPESRESSPGTTKLGLRDRSGSMASRLSLFQGGNPPRGRPESIQVTARIVRDPTQPFPKVPDLRPESAEFTSLDLKQSPLVVDHYKAEPVLVQAPASAPLMSIQVNDQDAPKKETIQERRMSKEKRRSQSQDRATITGKEEEDGLRPRRRSSLSIVKDFIKDRRGSLLGPKSPSTDNLMLASPSSVMTPGKSPSRPPSVHATNSLARRLSISSRRSSISKDRDLNTPPLPTPMSPTPQTETSGSGDESRSSPNESGHKKTGSGNKNRASRFMRRLSSSLGTTRKTNTPSISPTVAEEDEAMIIVPSSRGSSAPHQPSIVSYMGDVNVQFPDNLLWKRRTMCLDSHGFLILSAVQGVTATTTAAAVAGKEKQAGAIKRYHLSDFRQPYTPEMELQELPNSVCLDFVDGSGLQIACEDRAGQLGILHILQDAHQSHTSFGL